MDDDEGRLTADDYRRIAEFRYHIRRFLNFSTRAARASGIEPRQHQLLLALKGLPDDLEPSIGTLANRLQLHHNTAVELVNRLSHAGLVTRRKSDTDRRKVYVELTEKGEALLAELTRYHLRELRTIGPALVRTLDNLIERDASSEEDVARGYGE